MSGTSKTVKTSPFLKMIVVIFVALLAVYIPLKIYIARTGGGEPVADGTTVSIFVTADLHGYREPCG